MSTPLIRQGEGPLAAHQRQHDERIARERDLARIIREADITVPDATPAKHGVLPGDTRALRGIPAIGYGVSGAIPGTRPGA